jgi:hypothetical protein
MANRITFQAKLVGLLAVTTLWVNAVNAESPDSEMVPTMPEAPSYPADSGPPSVPLCDVSLDDLAGQFPEHAWGRQRINFDPSRMRYDEERDLWYDDFSNHTWVCQLRSNAEAVVGKNLVHYFGIMGGDAAPGDSFLDQRLDLGRDVFDSLASEACAVCGVLRLTGCFPPGVKVAINSGKESKAVEDIAAGDVLWNPVKKKSIRVLTVVEGLEDLPLLKITAGSLSLTVTEGHPIYTAGGIKQAKELATTDTIFDADGAAHSVAAITALPVKAGQTVINFTLDGDEEDRLFLADGMIVSDLTTQRELATK